MHATFGSASNTKIDKVEVVEHAIVKNREHVFEMLKEVERKGGEGLMLRKAESYVPHKFHADGRELIGFTYRLYEGHRSSTLLKVKVRYWIFCYSNANDKR
jgi:DNA ligase-1